MKQAEGGTSFDSARMSLTKLEPPVLCPEGKTGLENRHGKRLRESRVRSVGIRAMNWKFGIKVRASEDDTSACNRLYSVQTFVNIYVHNGRDSSTNLNFATHTRTPNARRMVVNVRRLDGSDSGPVERFVWKSDDYPVNMSVPVTIRQLEAVSSTIITSKRLSVFSSAGRCIAVLEKREIIRFSEEVSILATDAFDGTLATDAFDDIPML
ncbi:uncharacterized protein LAESUDRAFT_748944 [Laetiporus sulphureus 93-53]|uniref:Uncharacterized protein n=1 Tax=Laetiporus sulphureus 93-53 TaxID=1314785 RepID=A0A165F5Y8_9APHY|nr:uncharacterized protein LAESUDRAFT_748944 [Laetiporus sulphureus 93-53]KZT08455.1 hypothetical protein LAESUDRAFT_748944 [Laetiporus sulphureus 93-53]